MAGDKFVKKQFSVAYPVIFHYRPTTLNHAETYSLKLLSFCIQNNVIVIYQIVRKALSCLYLYHDK